jgi:hypothetical protein
LLPDEEEMFRRFVLLLLVVIVNSCEGFVAGTVPGAISREDG